MLKYQGEVFESIDHFIYDQEIEVDEVQKSGFPVILVTMLSNGIPIAEMTLNNYSGHILYFHKFFI